MAGDIRSYMVSIDSSHIDDLKQRLSLARFPDELDSPGWDMGVPLDDIKRLTNYWQTKYDWKATEKQLNKLPQFVTDIQCDGFDPLAIHYIYQPSKVEGAIPLLVIHGWPGHVFEVEKILKPLTDGGADVPAFHVVAPSLPNFGFSEGVKKRGFAVEQYAETLNKLMLKLGYNEYVTQAGSFPTHPTPWAANRLLSVPILTADSPQSRGCNPLFSNRSAGDWGFHISRSLAHLYPQHCKATHLNFDVVNPPSFFKNPILAIQHLLTPYSKAERKGLERAKWFTEQGFGYNIEQSTKPQTLGYGLADSPVALLAWIYEKLHDWTDSYPFTDDEICTWVSIYWFSTAGPAASCRIYYETTQNVDNRPNKMDWTRMRSYSPGVKLGFSHFPRELYSLPGIWYRTLGEVVFERHHKHGGHFGAFEQPQEIVADVREMYGRGGGAFGVVKGATGYSS